ncbi:hypothetical protein F5X98DRAFT_379709 [Xylaria grammica]|nr:hypothetical protein F5X98DRAFT_379709 [Xylaria grammica]
MRPAVFSAIVGLAAALPGQVVERQVATSTVTAAAHPLTFHALARLAPTATPLSYGDPPSPSRVPTGLHNAANPGCASACLSLPPTANQTSTSVTPTTTTVSTTICTIIQGQYPISTLPAFCRPTLFANAPALASPADPQAARPTAIVTMSANSVPDKVSCCGECATYYNCFAWRFVPAYVDAPSARLPGGFDPWRHGNCEIAYYTGNNRDQDGNIALAAKDGIPRVCPNGQLRDVLNGTVNPDGGDGSDPWRDGLFYNGWNSGACAADLGDLVFLAGRDPGIGGESGLCRV